MLSCDVGYDQKIIGSWEGSNKNFNLFIEIKNINDCSVIINHVDSNKKIIGDCLINPNKSPMPFTIIKSKQIDYSMHSIIKFRGKNQIEIGKFSKLPRTRPLVINKEDKITLNRIK